MKDKSDLEQFDYNTIQEKVEWSETSETYDIELLYELENNEELIRLEMNTIEYPLFSKNRKIGKNTRMTYEFNHKQNQYLRIEPIMDNKIPGEFEEKIFFALLKLYKRNGHNQLIYTDFSTLIAEMRMEHSGKIQNLVRKGLKILGGSTYEFNNLFYSNEKKGIINDNLRTHMFDIRIITLKEIKEIKNSEMLKFFRNSKVKEIIEINFSRQFYINIIQKGYLYFDRQDLLQIENPVSRTLFMMLTKWRNKGLYLKRYSKFLASRIPLSWKKTNITGTLKIMHQAFDDLKEKEVIKEYRFNSDKGRDNSYFEIWFDESHNKNYFQKNVQMTLLPEENTDFFEITNQIKEDVTSDSETTIPIVESEITKQTRELLELLPEKAKTLKTMKGKIEKGIKKYGYDYIKGAVLYTTAKAKNSYGKYFDGTVSDYWHEEFYNDIKNKEKKDIEKEDKKNREKLKEKELEKEQEKQKQVELKIKQKFEKLSLEEQENIEKLVYGEYLKENGGKSNIYLESAFGIAKNYYIAQYLLRENYFNSEKIRQRQEELEVLKIINDLDEKEIEVKLKENNKIISNDIIKIEKKYLDIIDLKFDVFENLTGKLDEGLLRNIMNFLNIEAEFKGIRENYQIEIKFNLSGNSLIYIKKLGEETL